MCVVSSKIDSQFARSLIIYHDTIEFNYGTLDTNYTCYCEMGFRYFNPPIPGTKSFFYLPQPGLIICFQEYQRLFFLK